MKAIVKLSGVLAWMVMAGWVGNKAEASVVLFDPFDDASAFGITALAGTSPNTNVPGGTWVVRGSNFTAQCGPNSGIGDTATADAPGTNVNHGFVNFDRATVSLAGSNSGILTISAYIKSAGGSGLGFSNVVANASSGYQFYGINFTNTGAIQTTYAGTNSSSIAYVGTFDNTLAYKLTYSVDTATGALTAISVQGSTADYSSLLGGTSFSTTNTAFVSLDSPFAGSYVNLTVDATAVPEPSTYALMAFGLGALAFLRRRKSTNA